MSQMTPSGGSDVTRLLVNWGNGDQQALEQLLPLVYDELRRLAGAYLRREKSGHTLQSTALVHEAFLKLIQQRDVQWRNRAHFFGIAAQMIRRILVDHARAGMAEKRGSGGIKVELNEGMAAAAPRELDVLELDTALAKLAQMDERQARIVELRFFAGMSVEETAEVVQLSPATVKREWSSARAWLFREMSRASSSS